MSSANNDNISRFQLQRKNKEKKETAGENINNRLLIAHDRAGGRETTKYTSLNRGCVVHGGIIRRNCTTLRKASIVSDFLAPCSNSETVSISTPCHLESWSPLTDNIIDSHTTLQEVHCGRRPRSNGSVCFDLRRPRWSCPVFKEKISKEIQPWGYPHLTKRSIFAALQGVSFFRSFREFMQPSIIFEETEMLCQLSEKRNTRRNTCGWESAILVRWIQKRAGSCYKIGTREHKSSDSELRMSTSSFVWTQLSERASTGPTSGNKKTGVRCGRHTGQDNIQEQDNVFWTWSLTQLLRADCTLNTQKRARIPRGHPNNWLEKSMVLDSRSDSKGSMLTSWTLRHHYAKSSVRGNTAFLKGPELVDWMSKIGCVVRLSVSEEFWQAT